MACGCHGQHRARQRQGHCLAQQVFVPFAVAQRTALHPAEAMGKALGIHGKAMPVTQEEVREAVELRQSVCGSGMHCETIPP